MICVAVPVSVTVPVPLPASVAPAATLNEPCRTLTVVVSAPLSMSATLIPLIALAVSSLVVCATGTTSVGASLIAATLTVIVEVSVTPPDVTVYVNESGPL